MRTRILTLLALTATVARADTAGVKFEASVTQENITLVDLVELRVTLEHSGSQPFESYRAPAAPDFDLVHTEQGEQMQFANVNGRPSVRMVDQHVYVLKPRKRGALTIQPATVRIGGAELKTRAIVVHVGAPLKNALPSVDKTPSIVPPATMGGDDLVIDVSVDKQKVYIGQQVTASWRLYAQSDILRYGLLAEPKYEDFWCEDLFVPTTHLSWDRATLKGQEYRAALLLEKALFPLKAGKLNITPLEAEVTTGNGLFMAGASERKKSRLVTVEVMPLPTEGRPAAFESSNVGSFTLAAAVDRDKVKAGEAVTLKLVARGSGNIRNLRLPKLDKLDGFRVYEPTTKETIEPGQEVHGQKVYSYLLLPQKGGALTLPAFALPYFDPRTAKYEVAKSAPLTLTVEGDPEKLEVAPAASPTENVLGQQIRPIRNRAGVRSGVGERLFRGRLGVVMLLAPPLLWLLVLVGDALRKRLARETAGSKRRRARASARRRLRAAEYHIKMQRPSAFFGECARVIYEHLEYRLGAKVEGLTLGELRTHLVARGFERAVAEAAAQELENCDVARFAQSASGPGEMRAAMRRTRALLGLIEKQKTATGKEAA